MGSLVEDLLQPGVELRETHISWVFLTATDAFKVKKPVEMGFLDFSTLDKRRAVCESEVLLNRRLAPHVYHGVVPVRRDAAGRHRIDVAGGQGEVVDWAVHMKRLPDSDRADVRLEEKRFGDEDVERVAARFARFHAACRHTESVSRYGDVEAVRFNVEENFEQTRDTIGEYLSRDQVAEVESWQRRFLEENEELFAQRVRDARVRDGHGDLRLEHIYIDDAGSVSVIDCIEFNERFRFADVCADIVFLAMDLAWHGRVDLAERFVAFYAREANDYDLYPLVDFYESYRAFVRGKISSWVAVAESAGFEARQRAASEARRYYLLALASERRALLPPSVVVVGGVIASGKSTIANRIGRGMTAPVVDADRTRKYLADVSPETPVRVGAFEGVYSAEFSERVYLEIARRADAVLASKRPVVLEATFRSRAWREAARDLARSRDVPFVFVECRPDLDVCRARLRERESETGVSDGRLEIFDDFVNRWEPVDEIAASEHVVLDTARPLDESERALRRRIRMWPEGFEG